MAKVTASERRRELGRRVNTSGKVMPTPCGQCRREGTQCRLDVSSGYCGRCLEKNRRCDLVVTQAECALTSP